MDLEKHISEQKDLLKMMDLSEFSETVQPKEGEQRAYGSKGICNSLDGFSS